MTVLTISSDSDCTIAVAYLFYCLLLPCIHWTRYQDSNVAILSQRGDSKGSHGTHGTPLDLPLNHICDVICNQQI